MRTNPLIVFLASCPLRDARAFKLICDCSFPQTFRNLCFDVKIFIFQFKTIYIIITELLETKFT